MAFDSARGVTVLFGGYFQGRAETWEWDGDTWSEIHISGPARWAHAMTYDSARDAIVLFGGSDGGNETWELRHIGFRQPAGRIEPKRVLRLPPP